MSNLIADFFLLLNLIQDCAVLRHLSTVAIEDAGHLFQGVTSCLGIGVVDRGNDQEAHHDINNVVLPCDCLKSNGVCEYVEKYCCQSGGESDSDPTSTEPVWPDLCWVCDKQWGEGDVVKCVVDE